jgi:CRP-like cAMP-binding protein
LSLTLALSPAELEFLQRGPWFGSLPAELQSLIVERSNVRSFRKGECLIREGEPGKGVFAVLRGRTRHLRSISGDDEVLLHVGEPGLWFGEYPMLARAPSIGSVVADTATRALFLSATEFRRIVDAEPRYYWPFCELLCERFALLYKYVAEARGLAPEEWLRERLAGIIHLQRMQRPVQDTATIKMSQSELANMIGLSRQTLNGLLASLQARGVVEVSYRTIRLLE